MKMYIFLMSIFFIVTSNYQNSCTCSQIQEEIDCSKSPRCIFVDSKCHTNPNFVSTNSNKFNCSNFTQEECRLLKECYFQQGQCQKFSNCQNLFKNSCEQSSDFCVSDGRKCIDKGECSSYITQIACNSIDLQKKYCFWNNKKCRSVESCQESPISLKTDKQCRAQFSHCTVAKGGGCIDSPKSCDQHEIQSQCYTTYDQMIQCFWEANEQVCKERLCKNAKYESQEECQQIKNNCTSDGSECIEISDCSSYKTQAGCKYDKSGKACVFVKQQCFTKSCATATEEYTILEQCNQYLFEAQCVPKLSGGCKDFPNDCPEFETSDSCLKLNNGTECYWNKNQCKTKECSDAPSEFNYQNCPKWMGNCIGRTSGGCTERPAQCSEIQDPLSCDYDINNKRCFFDSIENQCKNLICSNLKLPLYSNHSQCQEKLASCTFSPINGGCFEFTCANIIDLQGCDQDSSGFPCILNGCITKTCFNAPKSLEDHTQCEQWNSSCTLKRNGNGCEYKQKLCSEYLEGQCYYTDSGNKCIWKANECQDTQCSDAPKVSYGIHEKCLSEWKVILGKCTLAYSGLGCQQWPSTCMEITQSPLCLIGTVNGESCSWFSSSCQIKDCSNAPDIYKSMSQCSIWLSNCTFDNSICVDKSTVQCNSMNSFTTHSECYEWNTNCTIALEQGCEEKRLCPEYIQQNQCNIGSDGHFCVWDGSTSACQDFAGCSVVHSQDFSRESCESFNDICTISEIIYSCKSKGTQCSSQIIKQECLTTSDGQQCVWDLTLNICKQSQCVDNTTATTDQECLKYYKQGYCELKINSDGTYGIGCVQKRTSCSGIGQLNCNKTYLQSGSKCYFIDGACTSTISSQLCSLETQATSNEECQRFDSQCQLSPLGTGCVDTYQCSYLSSNVCNQVQVANHLTCHYENSQSYCYYNYYYYYYQSQSTCINSLDHQKRKLKWVSNACYVRKCTDFVGTPNDQNCQDYQSFCHYDGTTGCTNNNACSDVTEQVLCDTATDINGKFCAWDPIGHFCLSNELCENQKTAAGVDQDRICYDWQSYGSSLVCVANPQGDGCILKQNCDQIKIFIQCKVATGCYWVQGLKCQDKPMCHLNTTAILEIECRLYSPKCILNWNTEKGCNYKDCSYVPTSQCNSIVLNGGSYCYLNASQQCKGFTCSILIQESDCNAIRSNGSICYWNGTSCTTYPCNLVQNVSNNNDCNSHNVTCQIKLNQCRDKICIDYISQISCQVDTAGVICYWDGTLCAPALGICNHYVDPIICNYSKQLDGKSCKYDYNALTCIDCVNSSLSICLEHTCINYPGTTFTLELCQNWLNSCTVNPLANACIAKVDCKQAPKTYTTHSQCESYLPQCTVLAINQLTCTPLPLTCIEATDIQCYLDALGNKCYWSNKVNECTTLNSCDLINQNVSTHQGCNSLLDYCTVNLNLQGCVPLQDCADYSQAQCYISLDGIQCIWFDSQCQDKSCATADLVSYTNINCRSYFNSTCSLNELGTQCIESPKKCEEYNPLQCSSPDSQNFYGSPCIVTKSGGCTERICENSSLILESISLENCEGISSTCLVDLCRRKECTDFKSTSEEVCRKVLPKEPTCQSSPIGCIDRADCRAALSFITCTFDDKGQQCQWINDSCTLKTCQTAPINLKSSKECEEYLSGCIPKRLGGCMVRPSCPQIEVEQECNIDNSQIECNWNFDEEMCQYSDCLPQCGDGILTKGFEQCDDGNTLPYDGCYKCLYYCSLGCSSCVESQCQECEVGWRLEQKCETVCGDGLVLGNEECDDMNDIQFDGCYQCKFSCDEHCESCFQGVCDQCLYGWSLYDQQCVSKCGDGLLVLTIEQCDDANTTDLDGCSSQCQIEDGWLCSQNRYKITDCLFGNVPQMQLTTTKVGKTYEILVSFNQKLQFNDKIYHDRQPLEFIKAFIQNGDTQAYQVSIKQQETFLTNQLNTLYFTIEIMFLGLMDEDILSVQLQDVLENQHGQRLAKLIQTIRLQTPQLLSTQAKSVADGTAQFNMVIIYSLVSISVIGILMGNMDIFWNLLEQLQFLSYLRYINVEYPENLSIFLDIFSIISIQPILDFIHFETALKFVHFGEIPFIESVGKFQIDGINSYFINNIASTVIILITALLGYYIFILITKMFDPIKIDCKIGLSLIHIKWIDQIKWRIKFLRLNRFILKYCYSCINYFFYSELIRIFISSSYDILLSSMLQISKPQDNNVIMQISYYLALLTYFSTFCLILGFYTILSSPYPNKRKFLSLFENLKSKGIYVRQYHTYQLIKKTLFISALVLLQEIPIIQNLVVSMISMVNLIYLYKFRPLEDPYEVFKLIFIEFSVTVNTIGLSLSIVFFQNSSIQAWVNIGIYSTALCFSLILDIIKYSMRIYQAYVQGKRSLKLPKQIILFI